MERTRHFLRTQVKVSFVGLVLVAVVAVFVAVVVDLGVASIPAISHSSLPQLCGQSCELESDLEQSFGLYHIIIAYELYYMTL